MKLKIRCPAKINLTLKVFKKSEQTGFHPIESIMQAISLYDYLTIEKTSQGIEFSGNSPEIPYDETNLILKIYREFLFKTKIKTGIKIHLEKNIPVAAGLAGGSTDAAGMILGLNTMFNFPLSYDEIWKINASLGSDINFCYKGGKALAKGKGDELNFLPYEEFKLLIAMPKNLKISTKDAYLAFDKTKLKSTMPNDLEFALAPHYEELRYLSAKGLQMSGSGPSFFLKNPETKINLDLNKYELYENLISVKNGTEII